MEIDKMIKSKKNKIIIILSITFIFFILSRNLTSEVVNNIGVVEIEGTILSSKEIIQELDNFYNRDDIKAIIIRLNSPGGSVAPSQEIYEKVKKIASTDTKPIVASIGSMSASGGYYIAIGADKIIANPGSITGSIGVIMNFPIAKDLIEKIGLEFKTIKSGDLKDAGSPYKYPTDKDEKYFESIVSNLHNQFLREVSIQRSIPIVRLNEYADGRIFTGEQAYSINLIDTLGTFEDALNISKNLANISGETNLIYPKINKSKFLKMFFEESRSFLNIKQKLPMYLFSN
jgi:protease-4